MKWGCCGILLLRREEEGGEDLVEWLVDGSVGTFGWQG